MPTYDLRDKVVLITGAAGNLGAATAAAFRAAGARLVLVDLSMDRLQEAYPNLDDGEHQLATVNLSDAPAVEALIYEIVVQLGRIDVLVNIAGGYRGGAPVHETPLEDWDHLLDLNLLTAVNTCRAAVPHMLGQGAGKIVNVAARAGLEGTANAAAYNISKAAVIRLTESLAAELKERGINANCILPGTIDTPQNRRATPDADFSCWVPPEALADVILFLASDAARAIHGAAVPVYGLS
jgi:NAD(P)-dependent dehydrogenase (short-subunit alcohol dehydrogenase family)